MLSPQDLLVAFLALLRPWIFMSYSVYFVPHTILGLIKQRDFASLVTPSRFEGALFGNFWGWVGPRVRDSAEARVVPLFQGRIRDGAVIPDDEPPAHRGLEGTVIEVGAGTGNWVSMFKPEKLAGGGGGSSSSSNSNSKSSGATMTTRSRSSGVGVITRVYGIEPNPASHEKLRARVAEAGLDDIYRVLPFGIEDLATRGGIPEGTVDCVVCILCLCGIPAPRDNIRLLYRCLRPGGRMYVYEHVKVRKGWMRIYQRIINIFWPHLLGGCQLTRPTQTYLEEAGPWSKIDIGHPDANDMYASVPHILGVLEK